MTKSRVATRRLDNLEKTVSMLTEALFCHNIIDSKFLDDFNVRLEAVRDSGKKLDEAKVRRIRASYGWITNELRDPDGSVPGEGELIVNICRHYAKEFQCSPKCIQDVITGRSWKGIKPTQEDWDREDREAYESMARS